MEEKLSVLFLKNWRLSKRSVMKEKAIKRYSIGLFSDSKIKHSQENFLWIKIILLEGL
jgi:hypothetical protein